MILSHINILLADDDLDDRLFFEEVVNVFPGAATLTTVENGEELMKLLKGTTYELPQVLFLDLNMPRKNGFECLSEINLDNRLKHIPVIIYSTSLDDNKMTSLYDNGAYYYICKPPEFLQLKNVVHHALLLIANDNVTQPPRENFVLAIDLKEISK